MEGFGLFSVEKTVLIYLSPAGNKPKDEHTDLLQTLEAVPYEVKIPETNL